MPSDAQQRVKEEAKETELPDNVARAAGKTFSGLAGWKSGTTTVGKSGEAPSKT